MKKSYLNKNLKARIKKLEEKSNFFQNCYTINGVDYSSKIKIVAYVLDMLPEEDLYALKEYLLTKEKYGDDPSGNEWGYLKVIQAYECSFVKALKENAME